MAVCWALPRTSPLWCRKHTLQFHVRKEAKYKKRPGIRGFGVQTSAVSNLETLEGNATLPYCLPRYKHRKKTCTDCWNVRFPFLTPEALTLQVFECTLHICLNSSGDALEYFLGTCLSIYVWSKRPRTFNKTKISRRFSIPLKARYRKQFRREGKFPNTMASCGCGEGYNFHLRQVAFHTY